MFSAVHAQRHQVRRAGAEQGPCGRALFGAGQRVEAVARAVFALGEAEPLRPRGALLLARGPFPWAAELAAWPEGREAAPSVTGKRAGPGGRRMRCSPRPGTPGFPTRSGAVPRSGAAAPSATLQPRSAICLNPYREGGGKKENRGNLGL